MKIIVCTRTLNEEINVDRFIRGYYWADKIIVSDGGSSDRTLELLRQYDKVSVYESPYRNMKSGYLYNPDNPNINFIINKGLEEEPDFVILDDFDDWPNYLLRENARDIISNCKQPQINAFRLYMWTNNDNTMFYPKMNNYFDINYTSIWGWFPGKVKIYADETVDHGTLLGLSDDIYNIELPNCLLHYSWDVDTIDEKVKRYNAIGLPANHPMGYAGNLEKLPEWAHE